MRREVFGIGFCVLCIVRNGAIMFQRQQWLCLVKLVDRWWLFDNINRRIRDGSYTLFWINHWLNGTLLKVRFSGLFDLAENKMAIVVELNKLGWRKNGEVWKRRRRLSAWKVESIERLTSVVLQVEVENRVWITFLFLLHGHQYL